MAAEAMVLAPPNSGELFTLATVADISQEARQIVALAIAAGDDKLRRLEASRAIEKRPPTAAALREAVKTMSLRQQGDWLGIAVASSHAEWLLAAAEAGADMDAPVNHRGSTALMFALALLPGNPEAEACVEALLPLADPMATNQAEQKAFGFLEPEINPVHWILRLKEPGFLPFRVASRIVESPAADARRLRALTEGGALNWREEREPEAVVVPGQPEDDGALSLLEAAFRGGSDLGHGASEEGFAWAAAHVRGIEEALAKDAAERGCADALGFAAQAREQEIDIRSFAYAQCWFKKIDILASEGLLSPESVQQAIEAARAAGMPRMMADAQEERRALLASAGCDSGDGGKSGGCGQGAPERAEGDKGPGAAPERSAMRL
jgi:hypothetical protein